MNAMNINCQIVLIGICTYKRPQMLRDCLDSLTQQLIPPNISAAIVVVDNELTPAADTIVDEFAPISPIPIYYVHEPRRGIACARNAVLDTAKSLCADWIAFIDDDEIAELDWLANLMTEEYADAAIVAGRVEGILPNPSPFWMVPRSEKQPIKEGTELKTARTGNCRFSTTLLKNGLRFDERLGLAGGEDGEFFTALHRSGAKIRYTDRAVTYETFHIERFTYYAQMYGVYCRASSELIRLARRCGWFVAFSRQAPSAIAHLLIGPLLLVISPIAALGGTIFFKRCALAGGRHSARAIGLLVGLAGILPQQYRHTVGH